jgi:hypothetical protein
MDQDFDGKVLNYQRVDGHWKTAKTNMFALEKLNVADC